jgi:hypothetical protein
LGREPAALAHLLEEPAGCAQRRLGGFGIATAHLDVKRRLRQVRLCEVLAELPNMSLRGDEQLPGLVQASLMGHEDGPVRKHDRHRGGEGLLRVEPAETILHRHRPEEIHGSEVRHRPPGKTLVARAHRMRVGSREGMTLRLEMVVIVVGQADREPGVHEPHLVARLLEERDRLSPECGPLVGLPLGVGEDRDAEPSKPCQQMGRPISLDGRSGLQAREQRLGFGGPPGPEERIGQLHLDRMRCSCSYCRRRRSRWCCSARLASWK